MTTDLPTNTIDQVDELLELFYFDSEQDPVVLKSAVASCQELQVIDDLNILPSSSEEEDVALYKLYGYDSDELPPSRDPEIATPSFGTTPLIESDTSLDEDEADISHDTSEGFITTENKKSVQVAADAASNICASCGESICDSSCKCGPFLFLSIDTLDPIRR